MTSTHPDVYSNVVDSYRREFGGSYSHVCFSDVSVEDNHDLIFVKNHRSFGESRSTPLPRFHPDLVCDVYFFSNRSIVDDPDTDDIDDGDYEGEIWELGTIIGRLATGIYFLFRSNIETHGGGYLGSIEIDITYAWDWTNLFVFALNDEDRRQLPVTNKMGISREPRQRFSDLLIVTSA